MKLFGTYAGIVEANNDSEKLGRIKVRVPHVYGVTTTSSGYIGTNDLPWALPAGMPAGGSPASGGFSQLPEKGDKVWVRFLDGEPEKPIWEWGMQSRSDLEGLTLHGYEESGGKVVKPNRTFWTRYGHSIEINQPSIIETTHAGYRLVLTDESATGANDGNALLSTTKGNFLKLDDADDSATLNVNSDCNLLVGSGLIGQSDSFSWTTSSQDFSLTSGGSFDLTAASGISITTAADFSVDAVSSVSISSGGDITLSSSNFTLNCASMFLGAAAVEPFVLGLQLTIFLQSLLVYLDSHTHSNGNLGSPTGPPTTTSTASVQPPVPSLISSTIFGSM